MFRKSSISMLVLFFVAQLVAQPVELGKVAWLRDYDEALQRSAETDRPVLILFQEVPGCSTCQSYGKNVLSHPLLVEAIEDLFIPLCIYNNRDGSDRKVLQRYGEPSWNNPVVRVVNARGEDLAPRLSGEYTPYGLCSKMITGLKVAGKEVPGYLQLLEEELYLNRVPKETAYLSMYCFWSGEKEIGKMPGVAGTEAGYMDGKEVVRVTFDPSSVAFEELVREARSVSCADGVYTDKAGLKTEASEVLGEGRVKATKSYRKDSEDKYYLRKSPYRKLAMTPLQAQRVNSLLGQRKDPSGLLSPRQLKWFEKHKDDPAAGERWDQPWTL